jgi:activator of HSP90 ATPase
MARKGMNQSSEREKLLQCNERIIKTYKKERTRNYKFPSQKAEASSAPQTLAIICANDLEVQNELERRNESEAYENNSLDCPSAPAETCSALLQHELSLWSRAKTVFGEEGRNEKTFYMFHAFCMFT